MDSPVLIPQFRLQHWLLVLTGAAVLLAISAPFVRTLTPGQCVKLGAFTAVMILAWPVVRFSHRRLSNRARQMLDAPLIRAELTGPMWTFTR